MAKKRYKTSTSIYHAASPGSKMRVIRLNMLSVKLLLGRSNVTWDTLTDADRDELQQRFTEYFRHSKPNLATGTPARPDRGLDAIEPSIDQLPCSAALAAARGLELVENDQEQRPDEYNEKS